MQNVQNILLYNILVLLLQAVCAVLRGRWTGAGVTTAQVCVSVRLILKGPAVTTVGEATTAWAPPTLWAAPVSIT